jgi:hypothetical protein
MLWKRPFQHHQCADSSSRPRLRGRLGAAGDWLKPLSLSIRPSPGDGSCEGQEGGGCHRPTSGTRRPTHRPRRPSRQSRSAGPVRQSALSLRPLDLPRPRSGPAPSFRIAGRLGVGTEPSTPHVAPGQAWGGGSEANPERRFPPTPRPGLSCGCYQEVSGVAKHRGLREGVTSG